ncbi:MAG TPA: hypothetical protein DCE20_09775 [Gammaproteobacteria bacterium]|jgi:hypothetical protein|nr:hypothetical protein [Gammaproteobacteria bacterium]
MSFSPNHFPWQNSVERYLYLCISAPDTVLPPNLGYLLIKHFAGVIKNSYGFAKSGSHIVVILGSERGYIHLKFIRIMKFKDTNQHALL